MDLVKVVHQLKSRMGNFLSNRKEWDRHQKRLRKALPDLRNCLDLPNVPAKAHENFPTSGLCYSLNRVFQDVGNMKEWASQVLEGITLIAVDGSQIDFDRHRSPPIALVHIGYVVIIGGQKGKKGRSIAGTVPWVLGYDDLVEDDQNISEEWSPTISYKRWFLETKLSICLAQVARGQTPSCETCELISSCEVRDLPRRIEFTDRVLLLVDGTLIMSYLQEQSELIKKKYLDLMNEVLGGCKALRIPIVGIVSNSNAKELAETLWTAIEGRKPEEVMYKTITSDSHLLMKELSQFGDRTPLFRSARGILKRYKERIGFMYVRTDNGPPLRVEVPLYASTQESDDPMLKWVWESILAQSAIGRGFPYILARAHEAAVIRGDDTKTFYHMVNHIITKYGGSYFESTKSRRKRFPII